MSSQSFPEVIVPAGASDQQALPLATDGVLRYVWESRFGPMLVEVHDGVAYVNGKSVEPAEGPPPVTRSL